MYIYIYIYIHTHIDSWSDNSQYEKWPYARRHAHMYLGILSACLSVYLRTHACMHYSIAILSMKNGRTPAALLRRGARFRLCVYIYIYIERERERER